MSDETCTKLIKNHPGYDQLITHVFTTLSCSPPSFIYVHDPSNPRLASDAISAILQILVDEAQATDEVTPSIRFARINAVACFTPRLLYDSILNALSGWIPQWADGCENWHEEHGDQRWNDTLDGFMYGLRAVARLPSRDEPPPAKSKAKGRKKGKEKGIEQEEETRLVLVVERAERLKETLPSHFVPLTRLAELARLNITTIFVSTVRWEDIRPSLGAAPDPYFIDVQPHHKQAMLNRLHQHFLVASSTVVGKDSVSTPTPHAARTAYHPALLPLHAQFASVLYDVCAPFTQDANELAYVAAARWPGFVRPLLEERPASSPASASGGFVLPDEEMRMRLIRHFTPSFTAALEALYPRLTHASAWARRRAEAEQAAEAPSTGTRDVDGEADDSNAGGTGLKSLPRMARFLLVAAFLASINPPKSDLRMFGRLHDKKRTRAKRVHIVQRAKKAAEDGKAPKIPQRLSGPTPFPLDRLLAVLGVLLEENDVDARPPAPELVLPGEYTEMELGRVQLYGLVAELARGRLLLRTSAPDRLDGPPMFKCGISYAEASTLARGLDIQINDLMWEPP